MKEIDKLRCKRLIDVSFVISMLCSVFAYLELLNLSVLIFKLFLVLCGVFLVYKKVRGSALPIVFFVYNAIFIHYFRGNLFFYYFPMFVTLLILVDKRKELLSLLSVRTAFLFIAFYLLMYLVTCFNTGSYVYLLKAFEMIGSAIIIAFLFKFVDEELRYYLIKKLVLALFVFSVSLSGSSERLAVFVEGIETSGMNPQNFGVLSSFLGITLILRKKSSISDVVYFVLALITCVFSTSRVGIGSLLIGSIFIFVRKGQLVKISIIFIGLFVLFPFVTQLVDQEEFYDEYYSSLLDSDKSLNEKSSGRLEQWELVSDYVENASLIELLVGYGPGKQKAAMQDVSKNFSFMDFQNEHLVLHSLYLQLFIELGGIGLLVYLIIIFSLLLYSVRFGQGSFFYLLPFVLIGFTTTGHDYFTGFFLGAIFSQYVWKALDEPRNLLIEDLNPLKIK